MNKNTYLRRCYSLRFDKENLKLLLTFPKSLIPELTEHIAPESPFIKEIQEEHQKPYQFENFGKPGSAFGFEGQFVFHSETEENITYSFALPQTRKPSDMECTFHMGEICISCEGTGKVIEPVPETLLESGTMTLYYLLIFFNMKLINDEHVENFVAFEPVRIQLLNLQIPDVKTYGIGGWMTNEVFEWICNRTADEDYEVSDSMNKAFDFMRFDRNIIRSFRLSHNEKKWGLDIPGNACGAGTYDGPGYANEDEQLLGCHNVDSITQQMTLVVGLAVMSELLEKWLLGKM